jgi:ferrous iron transport protein B
MPGLKSMALNIWEKARDFLRKAFTIIFTATIIIWFLRNLDTRLNLVTDASKSMLSMVGTFISPVFGPLGFMDWRLSTALVTGLMAKETVVSTLAVLTNSGTGAALSAAVSALMSPASALGFLTFTLLYMPCVASMAVTRREIGARNALAAMTFQTVTAWIVACIVYHVALLF